MTRAIFLFVIIFVLLAGCTQRMVCPAYQSAFIYDKEELRKKFSYFVGDSTPKVYTASKNKYLVAESTPYYKKVRSMQTVPVKRVYVTVPDSLSGKVDSTKIASDLDKAARSVLENDTILSVPKKDSVTTTAEDSTYVISKDREVRVLKYNMPDSLDYDSVNNRYVRQKPKYYVDEVGFNIEQDNYMWYLRRNLVLPDVRIARMQNQKEGEEGAEEKTGKGKKKGLAGFFKNLFKKDKATDVDSAELEIRPSQDGEFDYIDTTDVEERERIIEPQPSKKSLLKKKDRREDSTPSEDEAIATPTDKKKKKKKSDKKSETKAPEAEDKKKTEEEDDGF